MEGGRVGGEGRGWMEEEKKGGGGGEGWYMEEMIWGSGNEASVFKMCRH